MRGLFKFLVRAASSGARLFLVLGLVVAAAALAFALGVWQSVERDFREAETEVPDLTGLDVEQATVALEQVGLELAVDARRAHEGTLPGAVFYQDPPAGSRSRRTRKVKVVVSSGSNGSVVPDLMGQTTRKAALTLTDSKLRLGDVLQVHSDRAEANTILAQDPPAGTVPVADDVDVVVSLGPRPRAYVMPDLRGRTREKVEPLLLTGGIRIGEVKEQPSQALAPGLIVAQAPPPGSRVTPETPVSLVISKPIEVALPGGRPSAPRPRVE